MTTKTNIVNLPSQKNIENVTFQNNVVKSDLFQLPFYKSQFLDYKDYVRFVKEVEKIVRQSDDYKSYINYLKVEIGLDHCQIFPEIDDEKASIEMHHGPILTLFDYVSIVTNYLCYHKIDFTTLSVSEIILEEHYANNVQIIMLSKSVHEAVHKGKIFLHVSQAWGNLGNFLDKYYDGLTKEQIEIINQYLLKCKTMKTEDNGLLETGSIENWNKDKFKENTLKKIKKEVIKTNDV